MCGYFSVIFGDVDDSEAGMFSPIRVGSGNKI